MLNVSEATKTAYSDDVDKSVVITFPNKNITFTNDDIVEESIELTEAIENEMAVSFKGCIASKMKFEVADVITDLRGEYVEVSIQAGDTDVIPLFKGYVESQDNRTFEDVHTNFTCYDALRNKASEKNVQRWINGLTYPITVKNFRDSLFTFLGIEQETKNLINDSLQIKADFKTFADSPNGVEVLRWICQLNAVFGQIGRDGIFHYRELKALSEGLYPSETTYPGPTTYPSDENAGTVIYDTDYDGLAYEPYETDDIKKVIIVDNNGADAGIAGAEGNTFYVQDNPLAYCVNNMVGAASAILAKVSNITHIPVVQMSCIGFPYLECADTYLSYTKRNICRTYIFSRVLTGIQWLRDEYSSDTNKRLGGYKTTTQTQISQNKTETIQNKTEIAEAKTEVTQVDNRVTTVNGRVTTVDGRVTTVDGRVTTVDNRVTQVSNLVATKASIADLNATNANVNSLNANKANVSDLNATNARVGALESNTVKTWQLSAQVANILQTFSSSVSCTVCNASSYLRSQGTVYAGSFSLGAPGQATTFGSTCQVRDINGTIRTVLRA